MGFAIAALAVRPTLRGDSFQRGGLRRRFDPLAMLANQIF